MDYQILIGIAIVAASILFFAGKKPAKPLKAESQPSFPDKREERERREEREEVPIEYERDEDGGVGKRLTEEELEKLEKDIVTKIALNYEERKKRDAERREKRALLMKQKNERNEGAEEEDEEEEEEVPRRSKEEKGKGKQVERNQEEDDEDRRDEDDENEDEEDEEDEELPDYSEHDVPTEEFLKVKNNTRCPFAKNSKVMNGTTWDSNLNLEENVKRSMPLLGIFNKRINAGEELDAFVIEIGDKKYGDTIEQLSRTVKKVLCVISDNDPTGENAMQEDLRSNFWNFHFGGIFSAFFISVLAPCYPSTHSRYAYGSEHTFILLQPEISFQQKAIKLDYDPKSVRHVTRKRFAAAGQPYDPRDSKEYTMCNWIVRPMRVDLPPIRWWDFSIDGFN